MIPFAFLFLFLSTLLQASNGQVTAAEACHAEYRTLVPTNWAFDHRSVPANINVAAARKILETKAFAEPPLRTKEREQWLQNHEIQKVLGQGAFGTTLLVRDKRYNRVFVLKITNIPAMASTLLREAGTATAAGEAGVGPGSKITFVGSTPVIEMEYIPGSRNLRVAVNQLEKEPERDQEVAALLTSAAGKLDKLHDLGIAHLDFKADNVLVDGAEAKIIDYGLALYVEPGSLAAAGIGTPNYIGPHVLKGKPRTSDDWYSFAMVFDSAFAERFTGPAQIFQRHIPGSEAHQRWTRPYGLQANPPKYVAERPQLRQFLQLARNLGGFRPDVEPPKLSPVDGLTMGHLLELATKPKPTDADRKNFDRGYLHLLKQLSPEAQFLVVFGEPSLHSEASLAKFEKEKILKPMLDSGFAFADKERTQRAYRMDGDAPSLVDIDYRRLQTVLAARTTHRLGEPSFTLLP